MGLLKQREKDGRDAERKERERNATIAAVHGGASGDFIRVPPSPRAALPADLPRFEDMPAFVAARAELEPLLKRREAARERVASIKARELEPHFKRWRGEADASSMLGGRPQVSDADDPLAELPGAQRELEEAERAVREVTSRAGGVQHMAEGQLRNVLRRRYVRDLELESAEAVLAAVRALARAQALINSLNDHYGRTIFGIACLDGPAPLPSLEYAEDYVARMRA